MKNSSASALAWLTAILLFAGLMMMSPSGSFAVFILAAIFAVAPVIFGTKKIRIFAVVLFLLASVLASNKYPEFKNERERIARRTKISLIKNPLSFFVISGQAFPIGKVK